MIVVVFGVSGVGKTSIGKLLAQDLGWCFYDADDFHPARNVEKLRAGIPLTDDDRWPWLNSIRALLGRCAAAEEEAVLACSALKRAYRDHLRVNDEVKFIYLRGDHQLIAERLQERRDHYMNPALLQSQLDDLEEPGPDEPAVVIDAATKPGAIVKQIRSALLFSPS